MNPARRTAVLATVAVTALLAACGSSGSSSPSSSGSSGGAPHSGGTLTFAVSSDAKCVDPQQAGSNDAIYSARQLVDSLTDQDPATGKIVPWLATSWEVSPDATAFTFHLRDGATFSDGAPVDAAAVKANFDSVPKLGPRATLAQGYLGGYKQSVVVDPKTVRVEFTRPNAQFLQATSTFSLGLVSPASVAKTPDARCTAGVVGSGPFVFSSYTPAQSVVLTRRSGYAWGSSGWKKTGEAYLDKLVFSIVPESGVRTGGLQSGQLDGIAGVAPQDEQALTAAGIHLQARANPGVVFNLGFNNARPLVADPAVRRAIRQAIDRKELVDTVYPKETKPATSILAASTPYYADQSAQLGLDADAAKKLLDGAGWTPGPDGIRVKGGQKLQLVVIWFNNLVTNKPGLELLQQQLKAVGVGITLQEHPVSDIVAVQKAGAYDAAWANVTRADPDILRTQFSTALSNYYRLPKSDLDALLAQQAATADATKRGDLAAQAQKLIVDQAYVVPVVELTTVLGVSPKVHDLAFEASSRLQFHDTWKD